MYRTVNNLLRLLESNHLQIRTTTGELIALLLEIGRTHDKEFIADHLPKLIKGTKSLVTDANKYRAKRELKTQRASFRDIVQYLEVIYYTKQYKLYKLTIVFHSQ